MNVPAPFVAAWNVRPIPAELARETDLHIFRAGFDTLDIAVFRGRSEASVLSNIHLLRTAERKRLMAA